MSRFLIGGVSIDGRRITRWFAGTAGILIAAHLTLQIIEHFGGGVSWLILDRFNVDVEESFPTWFSSAALLLCAVLLGIVAHHRRTERFARHWWGLALGFVALSADEIVGVHEALNTALSFPWTIPAAIATALAGLAYLPFLRHLDRSTRRRFILAGIIYVGGAVGIEQVQEWFVSDADSFAYALWTAAEEGAEMAGTVLLLGTLFRLLEQESGRAPSEEKDARSR